MQNTAWNSIPHIRANLSANKYPKYINCENSWLEPHISNSPVTSEKIKNLIGNTRLIKAPGFDLLTGEILRNLPKNCIKKLVNIINSALSLRYV